MTVNDCGVIKQAESIEEASKTIRSTIEENMIGGERWYMFKGNGIVIDNNIVIGNIAYNGRFFKGS